MAYPSDSRLYAPATQRNRDPILAVLRRHLAETGLVLEVASGSGEHVVHFAAALPGLTFQPTDPDPSARESVAAWIAASGLPNIRPPMSFDVASDPWPVLTAQAVLCINMIHIAPWEAAVGLIRGAAHVLASGGALYLYGPFKQEGRHTAPSNRAFDADLRARNPEWGVRDLEAIIALAADAGFAAPSIEPMPANNLSVIFRNAGGPGQN